MTDKEVMQMALDWFHWFQHGTNPNGAHVLEVEEALRTALAQPDVPESCFGETEPVAWVSDREARRVWWNDKFTHISQAPPRNTPLYTAPPQREWVGLTDEEMMVAAFQAGFDVYEDYDNEDAPDTLHWWSADGEQCDDTLHKLRDIIEAKLKEKNT